MSAPQIWILFPAILSFVLIGFRNLRRIAVLSAIISTLILSIMAWLIPFESKITIHTWSFEISERFEILGRLFILDESERPILALIYFSTAFWFGGSIPARTNRLFIPLGLGVVVFLIASLAIEPFQYAVFMIAFAVLLSVPILIPQGARIKPGGLRYITYQILSIPMILLSGLMLTLVEANPVNEELVIPALVIAGIGFWLLLALFPFSSWIPMIAEEADPYLAAFMVYMLTSVGLIFGVAFINYYPWIDNFLNIYQLINIVGGVVIILGGIGVACQTHLGRMLGFAMIVDIGRSLLAVGTQGGVSLFQFFLFPRAISLGVWALAITIIARHYGTLRLDEIKSKGKGFIVAEGSLVVAILSLSGFPSLAGFPVYMSLVERLAIISPYLSMCVIFGSIGLMVAGIRSLTRLVNRRFESLWVQSESRLTDLYLLIGVTGLIMVGIFPHWFFPLFTRAP